MKQTVSTEQRFNDLEMGLENMELHLLQAMWNLERCVQEQMDNHKILNEQIRRLLVVISDEYQRLSPSDLLRSETHNNPSE